MKKSKYIIDVIYLNFLIILILVNIGNYYLLNSVDTFYFEYLFQNWDNKLYKDILIEKKDDNNENILKNIKWEYEKKTKNFFDVKSKNYSLNNTNIIKFNTTYFGVPYLQSNDNYFNCKILDSTNETSIFYIDSVNNIGDKIIPTPNNSFRFQQKDNNLFYFFSSYIISKNKPFLDPKCNKLKLNNDCNNKSHDEDGNVFKIMTIKLSSFIENNNITENYTGNENITLYGQLFIGLYKTCRNRNKKSFKQRFDENSDLLNNINKGKNWLIIGLIVEIFLILIFIEKLFVSYIKYKGRYETLPNYVKPLLMIISIINFIIIVTIYSTINFKPDIFDDFYIDEKCIDINYYKYMKPSIKNYQITEILNIISLIISFIVGVKLGIKRGIKYAN